MRHNVVCVLLSIIGLFSFHCSPTDDYPTNDELDVKASRYSYVVEGSNVHEYQIFGSCKKNGEEIAIYVEGVAMRPYPICDNEAWGIDLDLTGFSKSKNLNFSIGFKDSSIDPVQIKIENTFVCPENYVGVPRLEGYTEDSFCVMKYEAGYDQSAQVPLDGIQGSFGNDLNLTRTDIISSCRSIGTGYDLINNQQWQTLVRNIELVASNWHGQVVGSELGINQGTVSNLSPAFPSADDNDSCFDLNISCDLETWHESRRTHKLSNNEIVWDVSGNHWELVSDNLNGVNQAWGDADIIGSVNHLSIAELFSDSRNNSAVSILSNFETQPQIITDHFGSTNAYTMTSSVHHGLGHAYFDDDLTPAILRGGSWSNGTEAGIFAFAVGSITTSSVSAIEHGFRCVYDPSETSRRFD